MQPQFLKRDRDPGIGRALTFDDDDIDRTGHQRVDGRRRATARRFRDLRQDQVAVEQALRPAHVSRQVALQTGDHAAIQSMNAEMMSCCG